MVRQLAWVLAVFVLASCSADVGLPEDVQLRCESTAQCPSGLVCVSGLGVCSDATGPCVTVQGTRVFSAEDGVACALAGGGQGICRFSQCELSTCGDGFTDASNDEQCDEAQANDDETPDSCRTDCTTPRCGDGVRDSFEGCDVSVDLGLHQAACISCVPVCDTRVGDCNGNVDDGCECEVSDVTIIGAGCYRDTAAADGFVYWLQDDDSACLGENVDLYRRVTDGSADSVAILSGLEASEVSAGGGWVYIIEDDTSDFTRYTNDGTGRQVVVSEVAAAIASPTHGYSVGWDGAVHSVAHMGGLDVNEIGTGVEEPLQIGPHGNGAVVSTMDGRIIVLQPDTSEVVAEGQYLVRSLAGDGASLYWINGGGVLQRLDPSGDPIPLHEVSVDLPRFDGCALRVRDGFVYVWGGLAGNLPPALGDAPAIHGLFRVPAAGGPITMSFRRADYSCVESDLVAVDGGFVIEDSTWDEALEQSFSMLTVAPIAALGE